MILCNLPVLLAERKLRISKVSADTGISRTTLTAMYYGTGVGVQFETLDKLCIYLGVEPSDLYKYYPFSLRVSHCRCDLSANSIEVCFSYTDKNHPSEALAMVGTIKAHEGARGAITEIEVMLTFPDVPDTAEQAAENRMLGAALKQLPFNGYDFMRESLLDAILSELEYQQTSVSNDMDFHLDLVLMDALNS